MGRRLSSRGRGFTSLTGQPSSSSTAPTRKPLASFAAPTTEPPSSYAASKHPPSSSATSSHPPSSSTAPTRKPLASFAAPTTEPPSSFAASKYPPSSSATAPPRKPLASFSTPTIEPPSLFAAPRHPPTSSATSSHLPCSSVAPTRKPPSSSSAAGTSMGFFAVRPRPDHPPLQTPASSADSPLQHHPTESSSPSDMESNQGNGLPYCWIEEKRLMPSHQCAARTTKIFETMIHPEGVVWKYVPNDYKLRYFEEFKKYYTWDESSYSSSRIYSAWLTQAAVRYSGLISRWKGKRPEKPSCVLEDAWQQWMQHWDTPGVIEKSEKQRMNRLHEVDGPGTGCSRHTRGSRSYIEHFHAMIVETGQEPNAFEIFTRLHTKQSGQFVDERSKKISEEVKAREKKAKRLLEGSSETVDMSQLYVEVVGTKKQRVYGLGAMGTSYISSGSSSYTSHVNEDALRRQIRDEMEQQFASRLEAMRAEMQAEMQVQVQVQVQAQVQAVQNQVQHMMKQMMEQGLYVAPQQPRNDDEDNM